MAQQTWTIKGILDWTQDYLGRHGDERSRYTAELLLTSVLGMTRVDLYTNFDRPLSQDELDRMHAAIVRRAKGEPVQYITGSTGFRQLDIICEPGVLIPRPETELLVSEVLEFLDKNVLHRAETVRAKSSLPWNADVEAARAAQDRAARQEGAESAEDLVDVEGDRSADQGASESAAPVFGDALEPAHVLEVGCGTGCISLSLAYERPGVVSCVATDINPHAVGLSRRNREALGISADAVDFREGDLVSPVSSGEAGSFDVLVSNPPYIPAGVMPQLPAEVVDYEPEEALVSGQDGLDMFRRLVSAAPQMVRPGGLFACELFEGALEAAAQICRSAGMMDVRVVEDLTHRPRMVLARLAE